MSSITALPLYKISNVPDSLRQLANRIESGEIDVAHAVVCMETSEGYPNYVAFGSEPFSRAYACGLCFAVANKILAD